MGRAALDKPRDIRWQGVGITKNEEMHTMGAECSDLAHTNDAPEPLHIQAALAVVRSLPAISYASA